MSNPDLDKRVADLIEGKGTELSRKLTKETFKSLPSLINSVSPNYHEQLKKILAQD